MKVSSQRQLIQLAQRLVDQTQARVIVPAQQPSSGFWFGGGNMIQDAEGTLWVVGRFRNHGDSRTGVGAGARGLELAIFRSDDHGQTFQKAISLAKADLSTDGQNVLSIEGTALRQTDAGVELYVSTEKSGIEYPDGLQAFLKPGTGVWTIDRLLASDMAGLASAEVTPLLSSTDSRFVHVKDPFLGHHNGHPCLMFCSHPFCWTSSNTGYVQLNDQGELVGQPCFDFFPRGFAWDVAITRGTAVLAVPKVGAFADRDISLLFYDGGECVRNLDEHQAAVKRPRGYSCEELGGLACFQNDDLHAIERLSINQPLFLSPYGTGCSRYVDVLATDEGYFVTWQQAQADGSQPLVMNHVPIESIHETLANR